jgi:hypothetical protein
MRVRVAAICLLFLAAAAANAVPTTPAFYIVGEVDRGGGVTVDAVFDVVIQGELTSALFHTTADAPASRRHRLEAAVLDASDTILFTGALDLDFTLRGEHAVPHGNGSIDAHRIELQRVPFVLRIPAANAEWIELRSATAKGPARLRIADLPRHERERVPQGQSVGTGSSVASAANRLDLLFIGDGYTAAEADRFESDVESVAAQFLAASPYGEYSNYLNIVRHFVASPQSGADHPVCKGDPFAVHDPKEGTFVQTAFDATYCTNGIQRLLTVNPLKVFAAAAAVPDWDKIVVIVNDGLYGGSGGTVPVISADHSAVSLLQHEYGHSFTMLADEYSHPYPGYPACSDISGRMRCEPNVTDRSIRDEIKWKAWIAATTPVPTPEFLGSEIGLFTGARFETSGFYRPKFDCAMRSIGRPFCEVCRQEYVLRLYRGWGGIPAMGVRMLDDATPAGERVLATPGQPVTFTATILSPAGGWRPAIQWFVDGEAVPEATSSSFTLTPAGSAPHTVEVRVTDTTDFVHPLVAADLLTSSRSWTVETFVAAPRRRAARH